MQADMYVHGIMQRDNRPGHLQAEAWLSNKQASRHVLARHHAKRQHARACAGRGMAQQLTGKQKCTCTASCKERNMPGHLQALNACTLCAR
eukprot:829599-Pelagomonas_calceolata.AAC.7